MVIGGGEDDAQSDGEEARSDDDEPVLPTSKRPIRALPLDLTIGEQEDLALKLLED